MREQMAKGDVAFAVDAEVVKKARQAIVEAHLGVARQHHHGDGGSERDVTMMTPSRGDDVEVLKERPVCGQPRAERPVEGSEDAVMGGCERQEITVSQLVMPL